MSAAERDIEMATAFLLADGKTHTAAELDALADVIARAVAPIEAARVNVQRLHDRDRELLVELTMKLDAAEKRAARAEHFLVMIRDRKATDASPRSLARVALGNDPVVPHAGECALCRAPFVRTETGAKPSCGCHETK